MQKSKEKKKKEVKKEEKEAEQEKAWSQCDLSGEALCLSVVGDVSCI